ncbi:MAG: Nif3-like dinuclear metal center hexameric protein [Gemmatimonadales bacterium]
MTSLSIVWRCIPASMLAFASATAQTATPTASQVIARIVEHTGVALPNATVDTFKAGDPNTPVRGIAVTMMATLDILQRAAAKGHNLIITHEPTFYSHRDELTALEQENDPVVAAKKKFIADHGLVVWRFHDLPHTMKPDMITTGIVHALGWEANPRGDTATLFQVKPTSLEDLAETMGKRLNSSAVRIVGDPKARVSRVALTQGFPGFATNRHAYQLGGIDVLAIGEDHEWETIEYATDAIGAGKLKGLIVLGHISSEQAGMDEVTKWLKTFIAEVPVEFVPTRDPFRSLH